MFDDNITPSDFPGVPGFFIPLVGLTADDLSRITAITRRRPVPSAEAREPAFGRPSPRPYDPPSNAVSAESSAPFGWRLSEVDIVLACLEHAPNGSIRRLAIREALNGDGTISRERIYQLGYPEDKALKGFSRPVDSAIRSLTSSGKLTPAVRPPLLTPVYDYGSAGTASRYRVPRDLVNDWKTRAAGQAA